VGPHRALDSSAKNAVRTHSTCPEGSSWSLWARAGVLPSRPGSWSPACPRFHPLTAPTSAEAGSTGLRSALGMTSGHPTPPARGVMGGRPTRDGSAVSHTVREYRKSLGERRASGGCSAKARGAVGRFRASPRKRGHGLATESAQVVAGRLRGGGVNLGDLPALLAAAAGLVTAVAGAVLALRRTSAAAGALVPVRAEAGQLERGVDGTPQLAHDARGEHCPV
jgi:hypothetical protein